MTSTVFDKISETYDTSYLDAETESVQDMFLSVSKQALSSGQGNITLMKLIANKYSKKSKQARKIPRFIAGPFAFLKMHSDVYSKTIVFFGEDHYNDVTCEKMTYFNKTYKPMYINEWLEQYLKNTEVFVDLYIEYERFPTDDNWNDDILISAFAETFKNCLNNETRHEHEICVNSRVHYMEIRNIVRGSKKTLFLSFVNKLAKGYTLNDILKSDRTLNFVKMLKSFKIKRDTSIISFVQEEILASVFIHKELRKSYLSEKIKNILFTLILNSFNDSKYSIDFYIANEKINPTQALQALKQVMIVAYSSMLEVYMLSRIFKKFQVPEGVYQPVESHNIIVYVGQGHVKGMRLFLDSLGFRTLNDEKFDEKYRCIDTINLQPYLF